MYMSKNTCSTITLLNLYYISFFFATHLLSSASLPVFFLDAAFVPFFTSVNKRRRIYMPKVVTRFGRICVDKSEQTKHESERNKQTHKYRILASCLSYTTPPPPFLSIPPFPPSPKPPPPPMLLLLPPPSLLAGSPLSSHFLASPSIILLCCFLHSSPCYARRCP